MAIPYGTKAFFTITVNSAQVLENDDSFTFSYDLSSFLSTPVFADNVNTENNIAVYHNNVNALVYKKAVLSTGRLLLHFIGKKSTTIDHIYTICVGSGLNFPNSNLAITNSNIAHLWSHDEVSGNIVADIGGVNLEANSGVSRVTGVFGNASRLPNHSSLLLGGELPALISTQHFTISMFIRPTNDFTSSQLVAIYNLVSGVGSPSIYMNGDRLYVYIKSTSSGYAYVVPSTYLTLNTWSMFTICYNGASINSAKIRIYINGEEVSRFNASGIDSVTEPNLGDVWVGHISGDGFIGDIDHHLISSVTKTREWSKDLYNMIISPNVFSTFSVITDVVGRRRVKITGANKRVSFLGVENKLTLIG